MIRDNFDPRRINFYTVEYDITHDEATALYCVGLISFTILADHHEMAMECSVVVDVVCRAIAQGDVVKLRKLEIASVEILKDTKNVLTSARV